MRGVGGPQGEELGRDDSPRGWATGDGTGPLGARKTGGLDGAARRPHRGPLKSGVPKAWVMGTWKARPRSLEGLCKGGGTVL